MAFTLVADSLIGFDSLLLATTGMARDTSKDARPLGGSALGAVRLSGSLDSLRATGSADVAGFEWQRIRSPKMRGEFSWLGGRRPQMTASVVSDSIAVGSSPSGSRPPRPGATPTPSRGGRERRWGHCPDSTAPASGIVGTAPPWSGSTRCGARLAAHSYRLAEPVAITLADSAPEVGPLTLLATDGSAWCRREGRVPGTAPGALTLDVQGLDLHDSTR